MNGRLRSALDVFGPRWWLTAFLIATLWVWQRYAVVRAGHEIERLQTHIAEVERVRDALLAENAALESRGRIEQIATEHLGLVPTAESQRVHFTCAEPAGSPSDQDLLPLRRNGRTDSPRLSQAGSNRGTSMKDF